MERWNRLFDRRKQINERKETRVNKGAMRVKEAGKTVRAVLLLLTASDIYA